MRILNHHKCGVFLVGTLIFAGLFSAKASATIVDMPTSCDNLDSCALVFDNTGLYNALSNQKTNVVVIGDFNLTSDIHYTHNLNLYLGDYTITSNGWSLLQDNGETHIYGGENGKIKEIGGEYAPLYVYGGTMTFHSGTIEVGSSSAGIYVDVDHDIPAQLIIDGGIITSTGKHGVYANNGGKIWLKSGTVSAVRWPINLRMNADFVMDGGTVNATCTSISDRCYGIASNGSTSGASGTKVTLNKGTINSNYLGMYLPSIDGTTIINNGVTINGKYGGIEIRAGSLTINGGIITVNSTAPYAVEANGDGNTTTGAAIAVAQHTTKRAINVTISGGTFTGPKVISEANPQNNSASDLAKISMAISGGEFTGDVISGDVNKFATGGKYSKVLDNAFIADNYDLYDVSPDGPYYVEAATTVDLPDKIYLAVGETYTPTLSTIAAKYGTLGGASGIVSVGSNNVVTGSSIGTGILNFNLHNYKNPVDENIEVVVFGVDPRTNDASDDNEDRTNLANFFAGQVKEALAHKSSGWYYGTKSDLYVTGIMDAISRNVPFETGLIINPMGKDEASQHATGYNEIIAALKNGEQIAQFFGVVASISSDNLAHSIGFASKIDRAVTLRLAIPSEFLGLNGTFGVLRSHYENNGYKVDRMNYTRDGDDLLVENDEFSTFLITFTPASNEPTIAPAVTENAPESGVITREGSSATVATIVTAIFVGLVVSITTFIKLMSLRKSHRK